MILEEGTDLQLADSLRNHLDQQGRLALRTIGERKLLWPLRHRACWEMGEIFLYFRACRKINGFETSLHLNTYRMNYPVPYTLHATVYSVEGYKDEHPYECDIDCTPAILRAKAHCYTGRPFRIGGEEGAAGVRASGANLREHDGGNKAHGRTAGSLREPVRNLGRDESCSAPLCASQL